MERRSPGADVVTGFSGTLGFWATHLGTGETVAHLADEPFETASCIKVPILFEVFRQAEAGRFSLGDELIVRPEHVVLGSGVLQDFVPGARLKIRDAALLMIIVSDNTATNALIDLVGLEAVNQGLARLGCRVSRLVRKIPRDPEAPIGVTTPREMGAWYEALYGGRVASPQACDEMRAILRRQHYTTATLRYVPYSLTESRGEAPPAVVAATKSGSLSGIRNDGGLIETPQGTCALAMLSRDAHDRRLHVDAEANVALPRLAAALLRHLLPDLFAGAD